MGVTTDSSGQNTAILFPGCAQAEALTLEAPLSFWGGVDQFSGNIIAVRHPQCGDNVAGRILFLPTPIGSSSSSAILLELIHGGFAPAGIILGEADAILVVGCLVARELGWDAPPILVDPQIKNNAPPTGTMIAIHEGRWVVARP